MASASIYESLRGKVIKLYNCKGSAGNLRRLSEIYEAINAAENYSRTLNATFVRLTAENEELKKELEALKKQEKTEKEDPKQETSDEEFLKAIEGFWTTLVEELTAGDSKK